MQDLLTGWSLYNLMYRRLLGFLGSRSFPLTLCTIKINQLTLGQWGPIVQISITRWKLDYRPPNVECSVLQVGVNVYHKLIL